MGIYYFLNFEGQNKINICLLTEDSFCTSSKVLFTHIERTQEEWCKEILHQSFKNERLYLFKASIHSQEGFQILLDLYEWLVGIEPHDLPYATRTIVHRLLWTECHRQCNVQQKHHLTSDMSPWRCCLQTKYFLQFMTKMTLKRWQFMTKMTLKMLLKLKILNWWNISMFFM